MSANQTKDSTALPRTPCSPCAECGMPVESGEYHPFAACLMFKACHDSETVKANLWAVQERSMKIGWENHEDFCRENAAAQAPR